MRIAIPADQFRWGGGIDFVKYQIKGLQAWGDEMDDEIEIVVLVPADTTRIPRKGNHGWGLYAVSMLQSMIAPLLRSRAVRALTKKTYPSRSHYESAFQDVDNPVRFEVHDTTEIGFIDCLNRMGADVVLPVLRPFLYRFPIPWIGYIFDFQHKHMPTHFTGMERVLRNALFRAQVTRAKAVIVNSRTVANDISVFYPRHACRVFSLPVCPAPNRHWFENDDAAGGTYPERFFLISNQVFVHKSHITAIEALDLLNREHGVTDVHLLCTGERHDWRNPGFFEDLETTVASMGLSERVRFLGHIEKREQIHLMRQCVALIQPTLYEGGPGGGAVYDAVAVGKRAIVSDIPVNTEFEDGLVSFFRAGDAGSLAQHMLAALQEPQEPLPPGELLSRGRERLKTLGKTWVSVIDFTLDAHQHPRREDPSTSG